MPNVDVYRPLLDLSNAIAENREEYRDNPSQQRRGELEKERKLLDQRLNEACEKLIRGSVEGWTNTTPLASVVARDIEQLKEVADSSWFPAIDDVSARLVTIAKRETSKSPARRKIEKYAAVFAFAGCLLFYFGLKWFWLIDVSSSIETVNGVVERSAAFEKAIDYDDLMHTRVRKGGLLKGLVFWPAKPTEDEITSASEFVGAASEVYAYLEEQGAVCSVDFGNQDGLVGVDSVTTATVALKHIKVPGNIERAESGALLLAAAFVERMPCEPAADGR